MKTNRMVLLSMMVTLGSGALAYYLPEPYRSRTLWGKGPGGALPPMRFFIGAGVAFFGISAVGEFKPEVAGPFSALVATTALLYNGVPALEYLTKQGSAPKPGTPITDAPNPTAIGNAVSQSKPGTPITDAPNPTAIGNAVSQPYTFPTPTKATVKSPHVTKPQTVTIVVPGTQGKKLRLAANQ